jgi:hypothetical protein
MKTKLRQLKSKLLFHLKFFFIAFYYAARHPKKFYNALSARGKKYAIRGLILLLIILIAVPATFWYQAQHAKAAWWDDNWAYRQKIQLTNSTGSDLTDFQVSTVVDTASLITAGKMITGTCADMRFTDSKGQQLDYWIEENNPGCNSATTKVWIKAPKVYSGTNATSIYMYYGNPSATATQSGDKTFQFFDDFDAVSLNTKKWPVTTGSPTVSSGNLQISTGSGREAVRTDQTFQVNAQILEYRSQITATDTYNFRFGFSNTADLSQNMYADDGFFYNKTSSTENLRTLNEGSGTSGASQSMTTSYYKYKLVWTSSTVQIFRNDSSFGSLNSNIPDENCYIRLEEEYSSGAGAENIDYIFTRKYASTDPTTSASPEEKGPGPVAYWKFDEGQGSVAQDSTVNNNDGNLGVGSSAPTWKPESECISGKCLYFDGSGDNVDVNDINY